MSPGSKVARIALARLAEHGVTTFFDITPPEQVEVYHRLRSADELTARVNMRMVLDTWDEMRDAGLVEGFGDRWIRYQGLKGFVDGIMGASSARFYDPYLTTGVVGRWRDASNTGYVTGDGSGYMPAGNMSRLVFGADSAGFNPRVHAIGDEDLERENAEKTSSVHFLRFELTEEMRASLRRGAGLAVGVDHPQYRESLARVPEHVRGALAEDLA